MSSSPLPRESKRRVYKLPVGWWVRHWRHGGWCPTRAVLEHTLKRIDDWIEDPS